jgi:hypothetical protein
MHRNAIDDLNAAGEVSWKKEQEVLADIIAQLKRGALVGKSTRVACCHRKYYVKQGGLETAFFLAK